MHRSLIPVLAVLLLVAGCGGGPPLDPSLSRGDLAYQTFASEAPRTMGADYRIGPLDSIDVSVFQEPELSVKAVPVDASGQVALPLIGTVTAAGKSASQLSGEIASALGKEYLVNPQVSVVVSAPVAQKIVVQGQVMQPGVYPIEGPTTLMAAVALAKGETRTAALNEVAVFRTVQGKRTGAVFNLEDIRRGSAQDPQILSNDIVVVGYSKSKGFWQDLINSVPLVSIFRVL